MQSRAEGASSGRGGRWLQIGLAVLGELLLAFAWFAILIGSQGECTAEFGDKVEVGSPRYEACNLSNASVVLIFLAFLVVPVVTIACRRRRVSRGDGVLWVIGATFAGLALLVLWSVLLGTTSRT